MTTHLGKKLSNARKNEDLRWFRPHDKTQVSEDGRDDGANETRVMNGHVHDTDGSLEPRKIHTVVTQRPLPTFQTVQKTVETKVQHHVDVPVVVQKRVPTVQRVEQTVEVPQVKYIDKVIDVPVVVQRQITMVQTVQKTMEIPQLQCIDKVVDDHVVQVVHVPQLQVVEKIVEILEIQMVLGTRTSESLSTAPVRQVAKAEIAEAAGRICTQDCQGTLFWKLIQPLWSALQLQSTWSPHLWSRTMPLLLSSTRY